MIDLLSRVILETVLKYENSYDKVGADKASDKVNAEYEKMVNENKDNAIYCLAVDYKKFYGLTLTQACEIVCKEHKVPELANLIDNILFSMWSDAIGWATNNIKDPFVSRKD